MKSQGAQKDACADAAATIAATMSTTRHPLTLVLRTAKTGFQNVGILLLLCKGTGGSDEEDVRAPVYVRFG